MRDLPWYGYVLIVLVIFSLVFFLYFKPKNEEIQSVRDERIQVEAEIARLRAKQKELDKIEKEIHALTIALNELETIIPQKREIYDILRRVQQLANDSRLTITKFTPKGEISQEFYFEWPIDIEISGGYHNLAEFFDRLSNFSRLFNVVDFSLKSIQKQNDATTLTASSTATTYIFRETPVVQPDDSKKKAGKKS